MGNQTSSNPVNLTTLDRETHESWCSSHDHQGCTCAIEERVEIARLARMVAELQGERDKLLAAIAKHHSQKADDRCFLDDDDLYAAAGLPVADRRVGDKLAMLENCKRFIERRCEGGGWPTYVELEAEIESVRVSGYAKLEEANAIICQQENEAICARLEMTRLSMENQRLTGEINGYRRSAELQEQVRKADACTECKGAGEIGHINQTELGPEGDSSECDACFGSGSQAMADKIGAFLASEFAVLVKISELLATQGDIARDEFESESSHIVRAINRLIDEGGKDYADMRRFQGDVIRLTHENNSLTSQLAAARAEVERLKADMAFCGIGYNEDDELALSMKPYNAFVRSKANETVAAESEQLKARVDHLTQELMREQDKAFALRAVLAQVGEKVKAEAVSEILRRQTDDTYPPFRCTPYFDVLRQIANAVSGIDIATIVAASATDDTTNQAPADSGTLATLAERIRILKSYLDNAPSIELDASNVRALVDNLAAIVGVRAETAGEQPMQYNSVFDYCKTDEHDKCSGQSGKLYRDGRLVLCACRCHWRRTEAAAEGQEAGDGKE